MSYRTRHRFPTKCKNLSQQLLEKMLHISKQGVSYFRLKLRDCLAVLFKTIPAFQIKGATLVVAHNDSVFSV